MQTSASTKELIVEQCSVASYTLSCRQKWKCRNTVFFTMQKNYLIFAIVKVRCIEIVAYKYLESLCDILCIYHSNTSNDWKFSN